MVYKNIVNLLKMKINSPVYNIGDLLPSEKELAELYHVSRNTLRKALKHLEDIGLIERKHGSGTWIRNKHFQSSLTHLDSFTEIALNEGKNRQVSYLNLNYKQLQKRSRTGCNFRMAILSIMPSVFVSLIILPYN